LDIEFANDRLARDMNDDKRAGRKWGAVRASALRKRLDDMAAADTLADLRKTPGRCEELVGNRAGTLSVRLDKNYRLIFAPANDPIPSRQDGGIDWSGVTRVRILEVVDYHD